MSANSKSFARPKPAMNVTPLVDVVLVLLIIFMVVIPALEQGATIEVPGIRNVDDKHEGAPPFTLSVTREGDFFLDEDKVPANQIEAKLTMVHRREPGRRIVLRGDKGTNYGAVRRVYKTVQNVGFPGVALRVNPKMDEKAAN